MKNKYNVFAHQKLKMLVLSFCFFFIFSGVSWGQVFWTEDFETDGQGSRYTASTPFNDGNSDHWNRTNGSDISNVTGAYTNIQGSFFWAAEDTDDNGGNGNDEQTLEFTGIDISGHTSISFLGLFGAGNENGPGSSNYDNVDYIIVEYKVDAGSFTNGICFRYENHGDNFNEPLGLDNDCSGTADNTDGTDRLGINLTEYSFNVPDGNTLDIRIKVYMDSGSEEIAFDNLRLTGTVVSTGTSTLSAGSFAEPATIDPLDDTSGEEFAVLDFTINENDGNPFRFSQLVFSQGTGNDILDWTEVISGVTLLDENLELLTGTVNTTDITFASIPNTSSGNLGNVDASSSKTYELYIYFKNDLGTEKTVIDGKNFVFEVNNASFTIEEGGLVSSQSINSGSTNNEVAVDATNLSFLQQPSDVGVSAVMTPSVQVGAVDANNNIDRDFGGGGFDISLTVTGSTFDGGATTTVEAVNGISTFSNLIFSASAVGANLTADDDTDIATTGTINSNTFDINITPITIKFQDFGADGGDWNFTPNPIAFNNASGDVWEVSDNSFHTFGTIPSSGSNFWGVEDLANGDGGTAVGTAGTLTFDNVDISDYQDVTLSFDWEVDGFDGGDDIEYEVFYDNVGQGTVLLVDGSGNLNDDGTVSINVPNSVSQVSIIVSITQNGSDQGSIDNFRVMGLPPTTFYYDGTGNLEDVSNWGRNTDGSGANPTNFTDDYQTFEIRNNTDILLTSDWTISGTSTSLVIGDGTTTNFNINSGTTLDVNVAVEVANNATFTVGTGATLNTNSQSIIGNGSFTSEFNSTLKIANANGLEGTVQITGSVNINNSTKFEFNGTVDQNTGFNGLVTSTGDFTITNTGGVVTLDISLVGVNGDCTIYPNAILSMPDGISISNGGGSVIIYGTVRTAHVQGFSVINTAMGSFQNFTSGTIFLVTGSTIEYTGGTQTVTNRPFVDYANLILSTGNKTLSGSTKILGNLTNNGTLILDGQSLTLNGTITGSGTITGDASATITVNGNDTSFGTLNFTGGSENLSSLNIDRGSSGGAGLVTLGSDLNIVDGGVITVTDGDLDLNGHNVTLLGTTSSISEDQTDHDIIFDNTATTEANRGGSITATGRSVNSVPTDIAGLGINISDVSTTYSDLGITRYHYTPDDGRAAMARVFDISGSPTNTTLTINYYGGASVSSPAIWKWTSAMGWEKVTSGNSATNISSFSFWTVADDNVSLPISLLDFQGKVIDGNRAELIWQTASEKQNKGFEVEKSINGEDFETVTFIQGAGNSSSVLSYSFIDSDFTQSAYYRLKQIDEDNSYEMSEMIFVENKESDVEINIYPNPFLDKLNIEIIGIDTKNLEVSLISIKGEVLFSLKGELKTIIQNLNAGLSELVEGVYLVRIQNDSKVWVRRLIKR